MNEGANTHLQPEFTPDLLVDVLNGQLQDVTPHNLLIALSGGVDSTVLLHALAAQRDNLLAPLMALHVDHGLHSDSGAWCSHCQQLCSSLDIPFYSHRLDLQVKKGESIEEVARQGRYQWFAQIMNAGDVLITAHHCDDQAETVLLQLLRGSGVHGLAAIPRLAVFARGYLLRPLLDFSRDQLSQFADQHKLTPLNDPANSDMRFQRVFIRHDVLPLLRKRWPAVDRTLSRTAVNCARAVRLIDELAQQDLILAERKVSKVPLLPRTTLGADALNKLSQERVRNLLRYWIKKNGYRLPTERKLQEIVKQLLDRTEGGGCVIWGEAELRRYRNDIFLQQGLAIQKDFPVQSWSLFEPFTLYEIGIRLLIKDSVSEGLRKSELVDKTLTVQPRRGGEYIRLPNAAHRTAVKKLYQSKGVPPWIRNRLPLLYVDGKLAVIPGIVVDDAFAARTGEESVIIDVETIA